MGYPHDLGPPPGPEDLACAAASGAQRRAAEPSEARGGKDEGGGLDRDGGAKEPWKRWDDGDGMG